MGPNLSGERGLSDNGSVDDRDDDALGSDIDTGTRGEGAAMRINNVGELEVRHGNREAWAMGTSSEATLTTP